MDWTGLALGFLVALIWWSPEAIGAWLADVNHGYRVRKVCLALEEKLKADLARRGG